MESIFSRTTLYDMLSMVIPGLIIILSLAEIYYGDWGVVFLFGKGLAVPKYICIFALSYLIGLFIHEIGRLLFWWSRNMPYMINCAWKIFKDKINIFKVIKRSVISLWLNLLVAIEKCSLRRILNQINGTEKIDDVLKNLNDRIRSANEKIKDSSEKGFENFRTIEEINEIAGEIINKLGEPNKWSGDLRKEYEDAVKNLEELKKEIKGIDRKTVVDLYFKEYYATVSPPCAVSTMESQIAFLRGMLFVLPIGLRGIYAYLLPNLSFWSMMLIVVGIEVFVFLIMTYLQMRIYFRVFEDYHYITRKQKPEEIVKVKFLSISQNHLRNELNNEISKR